MKALTTQATVDGMFKMESCPQCIKLIQVAKKGCYLITQDFDSPTTVLKGVPQADDKPNALSVFNSVQDEITQFLEDIIEEDGDSQMDSQEERENIIDVYTHNNLIIVVSSKGVRILDHVTNKRNTLKTLSPLISQYVSDESMLIVLTDDNRLATLSLDKQHQDVESRLDATFI